MEPEQVVDPAPLGTLAVVLAAVGELEAEKLLNRRGAKTPNASDVVVRLQDAGVAIDHGVVVETLRIAISDLGLATGVLSVDASGKTDARSLHVTMAGVRWLRNEVRRDRSPSTFSAESEKGEAS